MNLGSFRTRPTRRDRPRRGFGLVEMAVAGVLLATMVLLTLQLVGWSATDRRALSRREAATRLVANVLERALAHPWSEISTAGLTPLVGSVRGDGAAADGVLSVDVTPAPPLDGSAQKKIVVEVAWPVQAGSPGAPVRVVAWTTEQGAMKP